MIGLLLELFYENGSPSLTRVISAAAFLLFAAGSAYLLILGKGWAHYETFATLTGGGSLGSIVANKINNSLNNSPKDLFPDKGGTNLEKSDTK